ncbi:MAG: taurine dioxygenase [Bauldia sp.]
MTLRNTPFEVTPLTPAIGAKIAGLDLADPLSEETVAALKETLHDRLVLFFSDQHLTPAAHRTFAAHFGPLHIHPIYPNVPETPEILILDTSVRNAPDNDNWHTDVTFIETPPLGAALYAKKIPPAGGDTLWLSTIAAYDALSAPFKKLLDGLTAVHEFEKSFPRDRFATGEALKKWEEARAKNPPVVHPVVRTHPANGKKALFVNSGFTTRINELGKGESDAVLAYLFEHVTRPEFQIRHHWRENDLALWDNRVTQHYATIDYLPERRVMHRATIIGERPA